ncbi:MAG: DEAD/DEAH box helicase [Candidatus Omnitrophica bacterium]|nr:DEAD/DEAH box helicase [Candidatus Omnitrophota bacterium]
MNDSTLNFYGLGIAPQVLDSIAKLGFKTPTPIQHKAIPIGLEGKDMIGIAQTGTGKTMAFAIPMIQRLASGLKGRGLILVPTRELALQVESSLLKIAQAFGIRTVVLIGGDSMERQVRSLARNPRVLIATPGRLNDLMQQRKVNLHDVRVLVLDEADRMLDMGFAPQIDQILKTIPKDRQTMFFSATMAPEIVKMTSKYLKLPTQVEVVPPGTAAERVTHELFIVSRDRKKDLLQKLLAQYRGSVLLFCRTKIGAFKVARALRGMNHNAVDIHSDKTLAQRRKALDGFKSGLYRVLVATDIAARGIDVVGIELVINYDLPDEAENYVHRIGRTGRAGLPGHAISFAAPDEKHDIANIEKLIKTALQVSQHPDIPAETFSKPSVVFSSRRFGGRRSGGKRRYS